MSYLYFKNSDGDMVAVSADNPLPTSGSGGGGVALTDISAALPATWDSEAGVIGVSTGTGSDQAAAGNHKHAAGDITSGTVSIARIPTGTSSSTVALGNHTHAGLVTQQAAIADLSAAPTMEDFNSLLAALRSAGVIASA
jgi:hypothetical protein